MGSLPILQCKDLRKSFGSLTAVDGVSFEIANGETYGLLGPNGAGKTTVISMVCGLLESSGGAVLIDGEEMTSRSVGVKSAIGLVPQEVAIYPDLSGHENLRFFASLYGIRGKEAANRIAAVLEIIGLTDRADDATKEYSGGMQRRLNIGIGLLHEPKLLVLDEPTAGVDPHSRNAILASIAQLAEEGIAVLYTTHYMEEAERLCDRVGIIDGGVLQAEGTQQELVAMVGERDRVTLSATGNLESGARAAAEVTGVYGATVNDGGLDLIVDQARNKLAEILARTTAAGVSVRSVEIKEPDLEAVFLHLTGRALRD